MIRPALAASLDDLAFVFLDVETTGLTPRYGDRVCEVAALRSHLDLIQATFATLVNPERPISPGAAAVNGLSDRDVADAPRFAEIADALQLVLQDAVIVCHNAPFDLSFISAEMHRAGRPFTVPASVDTLQIARRCYTFPSNSLSRVARALSIPTPDAHRALGDAITTRAVFNYFCADLWNKGVRTLGDLLNAQGEQAGYGRNGAPAPEVPLPPAIAEALASGKRLFVKYVDGRGEMTERWISPQEVTGFGDTLSLVAFCHLRNERRQFRLDRIIAMEVEGRSTVDSRQ